MGLSGLLGAKEKGKAHLINMQMINASSSSEAETSICEMGSDVLSFFPE